MMIRAYSEDYLMSAQRILGDMLDYAINTCGIEENKFFQMFCASGVAAQIENGNPAYVAGKTGCELAKEVFEKSGLDLNEKEEIMYLDKSPEYWVGWSLAYYQWYTCRTFQKICRAVPITEMLYMYPTFHEADIMRFVDAVDEKIKRYYQTTNLENLRKAFGLTLQDVSKESGISVRELEQLEDRSLDINKQEAFQCWKISRVLKCKMEDLLEV